MAVEFYPLKKELDVEGLYTFFYFEHTKDFYYPGERHDFWEMVYVDVGEVSVLADNAGYLLRQGEMIFHKPMEFHAHSANKKDPHNIMVVTFESKSEAMRFFENKIFSLNSPQKKILSRLLEEGQKSYAGISYQNMAEKEDAPIGSPQLVVNCLEQLLISLIRSGRPDNRSIRKNPHAKKNTENTLVEHITKYLAENISRRLSLEDICKRFHLGKSYICQLYKETTGKSIIDSFIGLKIAGAKTMIREGNLNFTQIAERLGYSGLHHFTRSFKSKTGVTPGSYAKSFLK